MEEPERRGNSKQLQLIDWQRYFSFDRNGNRFTITNIYDVPLAKKLQKIYCVYCHTNKINGKKYIGITNDIIRRWRCKGIEYKPDKDSNQNRTFWNAIQKYGWDNFEHEILVENLTINEAKELEKYYIKYYESFIGFFDKREDRKGYNSTLGGEGTIGLCGKLHHNYGKKISKEQIDFIKENNSKEICQYSLDGYLIKKWRSLSEASKEMNIDMKSLWECLNGRRIQRHGYVWRYANDLFNKYRTTKQYISSENHGMYRRKHSDKSKELMSLHRKGKASGKNNYRSHKVYYDGEVFDCIRQCSNYLGVKYQTLVSWLSGRNPTPKEYVDKNLMYYENFLRISSLKNQ